ncbi:MAG: beta-propeller domain-containing protein [Sulfuricellaceae bacterium]
MATLLQFLKRAVRLVLAGVVLVGAMAASANDTLDIALKPGWNFIGLPRDIDARDLAATNAAIGDVAVLRQGLIVNARWNDLKLLRGEGVAVYGNAASTLSLPLPANARSSAPQRSDTLALQAGLNAVSLPVDATVSPRLFGDRAVLGWENGGWSAYPNAAARRYGYGDAPPLKSLKAGQGFLVIGDAPLSGAVSDLASQLQPFAGESEMLAYLREQAKLRRSYATVADNSLNPVVAPANDDCRLTPFPYPVTTLSPSTIIPPTAASSTTSSGATNTTSTNRQEQGVDESDIVKHNERYIFYTNARTKRILVTDFGALTQNGKPLGEISLGQCVTIEAMYLSGDRLAVVHGDGGDYWGMWSQSAYSYWNRSSRVDIFDVADPAKAQKIASLQLDGTVVDSRLLDSRLHLIVRYVPYLVVEYEKINACVNDGNRICVPSGTVYSGSYYLCYPAAQAQEVSASCIVPDLDNPKFKEEKLVPQLTDLLIGERSPLFQPDKFYAPAKLDQNSNTISVLALDIGSGKLVDKVGLFGNLDTLYMSTENLYLVSAEYPRYFGWQVQADNETRSKVYRFSVGNTLDYTGSAFVDGTVLNQFSLGEHQGVLRIATTRRFWDQDWRSNTENQVATLQGGKGDFVQAGVLGGLGKPGETIRSARFLGDKGYLVTFRNTDPLYTLDLSDPKNPRKVGELTIPGYSSYLHPVDEQRLLSIGRDADSNGLTQGLLVQLFDIADFAHPKLADKRLYGTNWTTRSSAENDHKAFTYRADGLLAFDLESQECGVKDYWTCPTTTALKLLKVDGLSFKDAGEIKGSDLTGYYYNDKFRSLLFDYDGNTWAGFLKGEEWKTERVGG